MGITATSILSKRRTDWICEGGRKKEITFSVFMGYQTSGTCHHLPLPHRTVTLRKPEYLMFPVTPFKKKKSLTG